MKKIVLKKTVSTLLFLSLILFIGQSCNLFEDNDNNSGGFASCNGGFSYAEIDSGNQIVIMEDDDISVEYFPNASNGPFGAPGVEISSFTGADTFVFVTNVITQGEIGIGTLSINNGAEIGVVVRCDIISGNQEEDLLNYVITTTTESLDAELCVRIDVVRN